MKINQYGFSLVETMVAIVILGLGLLGSIAMQLNMAAATQYSRQRMEAVVMAKTELEKMRDTGVCVAVTKEPETPYQGSVAYTVATTCPAANTPSVAVTWTDAKGAANTVQLNTML
jgi:type IV pilus assembly protein PilV